MSDFADVGGDRRRGYTDILTGSMHLLDIPAKSLFNYLVKGRLPHIFLPSFLHEATHYWCMSSDLGVALALLELRAHRTLADESFSREQLLHDFGVTSAAQRFLGPLLEGMALFQEFDAAPGDSSVFSSPGGWAMRLFQPLDAQLEFPMDESDSGRWLSSEIRKILLMYRLGGPATHRKTGVLMRSLSSDPHHYLAGYLTVKRIWFNAAHQTPAFRDLDLFLSFLREWIFQDWELINYLLDPDLNSGAVAYFISERLQTRLIALAETSLDDDIAVFNREMDSPSRDGEAILRSLHVSESATLEAQARMQELLDETFDDRRWKEHENWTFGDAMTLRHRQEMMRLAFEPVLIEVNEFDRVLVRKGPGIDNVYLAGAAPPEAERGITPGWVAAYFLPANLAIIVLAVRENQPMLVIDPAKLPEEVSKMVGFAVTKVAATEKERRELTVLGRDVAARLADDDYDHTRQALPAYVNKFYSHFALGLVPRDRVTEVETLLERKGLFDLLDRDGDLLTTLVELSLRPQPVDLAGASGRLLREFLAEYGIDLEPALERIGKLQERAGMRLILIDDNVVWSTV